MSAVLLDTHAWAWSFADPAKLSQPARTAIDGADSVLVSPISFFEIGQRISFGEWPEMVPFAAKLPAILQDQGGQTAPFTPDICMHASLRDWDHADPFDRLIASTTELLGLTLITKDPVFAELSEIRHLW